MSGVWFFMVFFCTCIDEVVHTDIALMEGWACFADLFALSLPAMF